LGRTKPLKPKTRKSLFLLNAILVLIPTAYFSYAFILRSLANVLIVSEEPIPSDAIAVLAGDPGRAVEAADLVKRRVAPYVLLTTENPPAVYEKARKDGIQLVLNHENYLRLLQGYGVPAVDIFRVESYIGDTFDEVRRVGEFASEKGWTRLTIVTSNYHTRRARMVARYLLQPNMRVAVVASHYDNFKPEAWWTSQAQMRTFAIELEKLITYSLYIGPRMLWKSRESTKPQNTSSASPDLSSARPY
jgi:uncharacterized SAM-binding protein YcdF (DUF218 family)